MLASLIPLKNRDLNICKSLMLYRPVMPKRRRQPCGHTLSGSINERKKNGMIIIVQRDVLIDSATVRARRSGWSLRWSKITS